MSFTFKAAALKAAALAAGACLALAGPATAQTQWIMASGYPENNFMTQNLRKWVEDVEKGTAGKLKITLHTNDSLIKLDSIKGAIQRGQVQGGEIRLGVYGNEDPMYILDGVPFLASTYDEAWKLMEAQAPYFKGLFNKAGMVIAGYQVWPSQGFYTKTPVNTVDDFKGKKIRIYSTATQRMATLLGFNATILPFAEIPQAFSTGLIEALFTSAQTGTDIQAWDNTRYFTDVGAILSKNALVFNKRAFSALPPADQKVLMDASAAYTKRSWEMSKAAGDEKSAVLKKNGMTVSAGPPAVIGAMKKVGATMADEWKATASPAAVAVLTSYMSGQKTN
ncbi:MAG: TRAP transporter substrate-binding protein [Reyranella sp.]|uniref:TRAP transporter substrate-binding protein n=1 Tax=Reyranella sp. TaxID=1929291 RepID=UPI003D09975E